MKYPTQASSLWSSRSSYTLNRTSLCSMRQSLILISSQRTLWPIQKCSTSLGKLSPFQQQEWIFNWHSRTQSTFPLTTQVMLFRWSSSTHRSSSLRSLNSSYPLALLQERIYPHSLRTTIWLTGTSHSWRYSISEQGQQSFQTSSWTSLSQACSTTCGERYTWCRSSPTSLWSTW